MLRRVEAGMLFAPLGVCLLLVLRCEAAKDNESEQNGLSTVGVSPVRDADEPLSIGLPASPTPL